MANRPAKAKERPDEILAAALRCFQRKGVDATSIQDICEASGASVGSIYHHFGSKEGIAAALYRRAVAQFQTEALEAVEDAATAEAGITAFVFHYLGFVERNPGLARVMLSLEYESVRRAARRPAAELNQAFLRRAHAWLDARVQAGEIRPLPPDVMLALLLGPTERFARDWLARRSSTTVGHAAAEIAGATWQAVRATGTRRR